VRPGNRVGAATGDGVDSKDGAWMVVGEVAGAFGIRGEIKVSSFTDFPDRFKELKAVYLGPEKRRYGVVRTRVHQGRILLQLSGIESPEQVAALGHVDISVPRDEAVPLPDGAYFLDELIGVRVCTTEDRYLGEVTDVLRTGSNDVWVVGHGKQSVLIPAIADAVQELNIEAKYAVILPWVLASEE
jgi:16S rRNA processing protein RimM